MCEHYTRTQLNRRLTFCALMACAFAAGMAYSADIPYIGEAARADKLGAMGILAFGFIIVTVSFLALVRFLVGTWLSMTHKMVEAITQATTLMARMVKAAEDCEHAGRR